MNLILPKICCYYCDVLRNCGDKPVFYYQVLITEHTDLYEEGDLNSNSGKKFEHLDNFPFCQACLTNNSQINL